MTPSVYIHCISISVILDQKFFIRRDRQLPEKLLLAVTSFIHRDIFTKCKQLFYQINIHI